MHNVSQSTISKGNDWLKSRDVACNVSTTVSVSSLYQDRLQSITFSGSGWTFDTNKNDEYETFSITFYKNHCVYFSDKFLPYKFGKS
jgi:hypothetical protein